VYPVLRRVCEVRQQVEDLRELDGMVIVVHEHVAHDEDHDAIWLDRKARLAVTRDNLVLDLREW
jgi:hypothetical protein